MNGFGIFYACFYAGTRERRESGFYHANANPFIDIRKTLPQIGTLRLQERNKILIFIKFLIVVAFSKDNSTPKKTFRFGKLNSSPNFCNNTTQIYSFFNNLIKPPTLNKFKTKAQRTEARPAIIRPMRQSQFIE